MEAKLLKALASIANFILKKKPKDMYEAYSMLNLIEFTATEAIKEAKEVET